MDFFYYSLEPLDKILSERKQGASVDSVKFSEKRQRADGSVGASVDAIELRFVPQTRAAVVPQLELVTDKPLTDTDKIYENVISSDLLPVNLVWEIKDTPSYSKATDEFWDGVHEAEDRQYARTETNEWMKKNGHAGRGVPALIKALEKYAGRKSSDKQKVIIVLYPYVGYVRVAQSYELDTKEEGKGKYFTVQFMKDAAKRALGSKFE